MTVDPAAAVRLPLLVVTTSATVLTIVVKTTPGPSTCPGGNIAVLLLRSGSKVELLLNAMLEKVVPTGKSDRTLTVTL